MPKQMEIAQRLDVILGMQSRGVSNMEIAAWACREWGVTKQTVFGYFQKAEEFRHASLARSKEIASMELELELYRMVVSRYQQSAAEPEKIASVPPPDIEATEMLLKYLKSNPYAITKKSSTGRKSQA